MEIYFCDLSPEAQQRYLKYAGITDPDEANLDNTPIAYIEIESE